MKLYHGSNQVIDSIDLSKAQKNKDFGQGFYLTDIREQAERMGERRVKFAKIGQPIVTVYDFDESNLTRSLLKVKVFHEPDEEWATFVYRNRYNQTAEYVHDWDIVVGPVADDGVALQLSLYNEGYIDITRLAEQLKFKKLNRQYYFGTQRAIELLKKL